MDLDGYSSGFRKLKSFKIAILGGRGVNWKNLLSHESHVSVRQHRVITKLWKCIMFLYEFSVIPARAQAAASFQLIFRSFFGTFSETFHNNEPIFQITLLSYIIILSMIVHISHIFDILKSGFG